MELEELFNKMYYNIWQSNDISTFDDFYAKNFEETISVSDENKEPIELMMKYDDLRRQAIWQQENYKETTIQIKKFVVGKDNHISVNFYSTSIHKNTGKLHHRCVCGIWHLNNENKIDRVWAVVTPYYSK